MNRYEQFRGMVVVVGGVVLSWNLRKRGWFEYLRASRHGEPSRSPVGCFQQVNRVLTKVSIEQQ